MHSPESSAPSSGTWTPGTVSLLAGLAILVGTLTSGRVWDLLPSPERLAMVLGAMACLVVIGVPSLRRFAPGAVVGLILAGGLVARWISFSHPGGSDVLPVTTEAIRVFLGGGNPYDHYYESSRPPGAPFPYPPVNLLLHLPGYLLMGHSGVHLTETVLAWGLMLVVGVLAVRGRHPFAVPMLALYAGLANLVNLVGDNSNDTSAGAMIAFYIVAVAAVDRNRDAAADGSGMRRWAILAGVMAAAAMGTKQSALPLVVAGSAWLVRVDRAAFRPYLAAMLATLLVVSVPFLAMSGPVGYVKALTAFAGFHEDVYGWNIWVFAQQMGWPVASREVATLSGALLGLAALVVIAVLRYRDVRTALVAGTVGMAVLFFAQRWTAYSYFAQLISVMVVLPLVGRWDWPASGDDPAAPVGASASSASAGSAPPGAA